ncbi:MAG: TldD/PmbA family protein [Erysipelotrichaceae bacterium]|nr:TldD/PmbA family protein [Erysipelotrichaceae bacterium]
MLEKEKLETYLSLCMKSEADYAEIFEESTKSESISMLNGETESVSLNTSSGVGIRLYKGLQTVYAYSNENTEEALLPLIDDLREAIGKADKDTAVVLTRVEYENKNPVRVPFDSVSLDEKISLLKRGNDAAKAYDERIVKVQANLINNRQDVQISTSEGRLISDQRNRTRIAVSAFAKEGENFQRGSDSPGAGTGLEFYEETTPEDVGREAARVALVNLRAKDCPSGKMPVIIDNGFGGVIFHEACGHSLEATSVSKNQSVFSGKMGEKIASDVVSAVDDGTIPNAWGSENIDDEGNFQQKRELIRNGVLTSYMIDKLGGRRMGMASTGSSRRQSYKYEPTSRMSNTYICAGETPFEDLFKGIKKGLYAKKMGGGSVNPQTGEFNFAVLEGYLIENGEITTPVRGASLIGNGRDILMDIDAVSDNLKRGQGMCGSVSGSIPTDVGQPAIRIREITVGGTAHE